MKRRSGLTLAAVLLLSLVTACHGPQGTTSRMTLDGMSGPRPRTWEVPARLLGAGVRDWSLERVSGARLTAARRAAGVRPASRTLKAFGDAPGWAGGLALSDPAFGVTGTATNAPAWAHRSPVLKLAGRVWFLTTDGHLLGVHESDPKNLGAVPMNAPIKIMLGHPCTRSFVTLSDDGRRAYVVTDNGRLVQADLGTGTVGADLPIDPATPSGPSVGMGAFIDPFLSDLESGSRDVVFAGLNNGIMARFEWSGGVLTPMGVRRGVTATRAVDGSTSRLVAAGPVALNGHLYYGDRAGNLNELDFDAPMGPANPRVTFLGRAWAIEAPVSVELSDELEPQHIFATVGEQVAWVDQSLPASRITLSRRLLIDSALDAPPPLTSGRVSSYDGLYRGQAVRDLSPVEAVTALVAYEPSAAALALPNGDVEDGVARPYRSRSLSAAQRIADLPASSAGTRGLLRWDLSAYAGQSFLSAAVDFTVRTGSPADVAAPSVSLAETLAAGGAMPWTAAVLTPSTVPAQLALDAGFALGANVPRPWRPGDVAHYALPAQSLPIDGQLALALSAPASLGLHHDPEGPLPTDAADRRAIAFHALGVDSTSAQRPRLQAYLSAYAGQAIQTPPTMFGEGTERRVFVMHTNALFRLDCSSHEAFANDPVFSASRLGRATAGPLDVGDGTRPAFSANPTYPLITFTGKVFVLDRTHQGDVWSHTLNKFDGALPDELGYVEPPASCRIDGTLIPAAARNAGDYAVYDGFGNDFGYLYFGLGDGRIYRLGM